MHRRPQGRRCFLTLLDPTKRFIHEHLERVRGITAALGPKGLPVKGMVPWCQSSSSVDCRESRNTNEKQEGAWKAMPLTARQNVSRVGGMCDVIMCASGNLVALEIGPALNQQCGSNPIIWHHDDFAAVKPRIERP